MDGKVASLETTLKAIYGDTETSIKLLKIINNIALKNVESCKHIPKSKANEKLEAYIQSTKALSDIKGLIVDENVKLEAFLISLGYIEDDEEEDNLYEKGAHSIEQESVITRIEPCEPMLPKDNSVMITSPVRFDSIPSTVNVESPITSPKKPITVENITATTFIQTPAGQIEISKKIVDDVISVTQICSTKSENVTNSNATEHLEMDVEEILKKKNILSLEERYEKSILDQTYVPDLRLRRSSSSSSSILSSSSESSKKTNSSTKSKLTSVNRNQTVKHSFTPSINDTKSTNKASCSNYVENVAKKSTTFDGNSSSEEIINRKFLEPRFPQVEEHCVISACKSPQNMYIQLYEHCDALVALTDHLNSAYEHCNLQYTVKSEAKEKVGDCCVAYLQDYGGWHRVRVLDWQLMSRINTVFVFVVDYGDTIKVPVEDLRKLMSEFFNYPMFAINCGLDSLYPPLSTVNAINTIWTTAELNDFYEFMQKGNQVTYKITYINTDSKPIGIDLADINDEDPENSLGQELINANIVKQILDTEIKQNPNSLVMLEQIKSAQGLTGINKNMTDTERLEKYLENNLYSESKNIVEDVTGYDANDERRVCKFSKADGTCFKGLNCKMEHTQLRADGFTTDKNFVFHKALHNLIAPSTDDEIKIFITCITRPNEFYGHILERDEQRICGTSLQQLATNLKNPNAVKRFRRLSLQPSIGQIVLAKNWDNTWCRARIIDIDGLTVDVFIVDYGETVTVNMEDLREISRDYLNLPFQAVKFCLWDIEKVPDVSDAEVVTYMETHYLCNEFSAIVRANKSLIYVDVYIQLGVDMCTDLITRGFGARTCGRQLIIETTLVD